MTLLFPDIFDSSLIAHGIFAREGGISLPPFDSLNVSFGVGDDPQAVRTNRKRIKEELGLDRLVSGRQVHGSTVHIVEALPKEDEEIDGCDAFISAAPGVALMVQQADCQALLLHDPGKKIVANIHNGWRGSVADIIGATISVMQSRFGSNPAEMHAVISPSLGPCCAEFVNFRLELPQSFHSFQTRPNYFDFWEISRMQLSRAGVRAENIRAAGRCTVCEPEWFSFRRDKVTGRFCSIIGLRP